MVESKGYAFLCIVVYIVLLPLARQDFAILIPQHAEMETLGAK
jgi:hypothetical protein